jgi:hypothetical protein
MHRFTRGWTLQELIAPQNMRFYNASWTYVGSKASLGSALSSITHVPDAVLRAEVDLVMVPVAQKMSWAANRSTTRVEDEAYCLLSVMPMTRTLKRPTTDMLLIPGACSMSTYPLCTARRKRPSNDSRKRSSNTPRMSAYSHGYHRRLTIQTIVVKIFIAVSWPQHQHTFRGVVILHCAFVLPKMGFQLRTIA